LFRECSEKKGQQCSLDFGPKGSPCSSGSRAPADDDRGCDKGLISPSQPAKKLKQQWQVIQRLRDYDRCVTEIPALNIEVLPLTGEIIRESSRLRSAHGLMTNDSVTAAMMAHHGMSRATTLDSDLQRVPGLSLYQPTDIP
jgi:hypothetical protein